MKSEYITPYEAIGGEKSIRYLVARFYFYMDSLPEAAGIRQMHANDLSEARNKLFKFLSGWLGGPDLFVQEYGHPRLRMRHFPFAITTNERDQWMLCMNKALYDLEIADNLRLELSRALQDLATHMINQ